MLTNSFDMANLLCCHLSTVAVSGALDGVSLITFKTDLCTGSGQMRGSPCGRKEEGHVILNETSERINLLLILYGLIKTVD